MSQISIKTANINCYPPFPFFRKSLSLINEDEKNVDNIIVNLRKSLFKRKETAKSIFGISSFCVNDSLKSSSHRENQSLDGSLVQSVPGS